MLWMFGFILFSRVGYSKEISSIPVVCRIARCYSWISSFSLLMNVKDSRVKEMREKESLVI